MRTAEEIIRARYPYYSPYIKDVELDGESVSELINEARRECIDECVENFEIDSPPGMGGWIDSDSVNKLKEQIK